MDDEVETLLLRVRADTRGFDGEVARLRGGLADAGRVGDAAGERIERALLRGVRSGKLGFDDLKRTAMSVLGEIAAAAVSAGIGAVAGGGGLGGLFGRVLGGAAGLPGRATGGPVAPGRAYLVGERGPELFVPTASGRVETGGSGAAREVRVSIRIDGAGASEPQALAKSGRQVARAVRAALERAG
ncbi:tail tape measure protein [Sphingomonas jatrophae]|uniref:Tail tape measure protein n=1 Tax=Sphingomonas jatrophae TaxID=1166337 RepID=A0A1I6L3J6_9SPHN|nr:tail tape measure protein [Sphingomonas jatrophae]SFR98004.1 hypothetical protein SAMN05192580_2235 [Sphingomonas jatrophae]